MKKTFIDLQLFAEETAPVAGATDHADAASDQQEPAMVQPAEEEKKYTEAEMNRIVKQKHAEWAKKQERAVDEAQKLATMNAQEQAEYALQKEKEAHGATQKELDEYKRKDALAEMSKTARKMLADEGITISDELLSMIVKIDADATQAAVKGFATQYKADLEAAVKDRLRGKTPTAGTGGATVSEIDKRINKYL